MEHWHQVIGYLLVKRLISKYSRRFIQIGCCWKRIITILRESNRIIWCISAPTEIVPKAWRGNRGNFKVHSNCSPKRSSWSIKYSKKLTGIWLRVLWWKKAVNLGWFFRKERIRGIRRGNRSKCIVTELTGWSLYVSSSIDKLNSKWCNNRNVATIINDCGRNREIKSTINSTTPAAAVTADGNDANNATLDWHTFLQSKLVVWPSVISRP